MKEEAGRGMDQEDQEGGMMLLCLKATQRLGFPYLSAPRVADAHIFSVSVSSVVSIGLLYSDVNHRN